MRQFILTENNNNLHCMASTPANGFAFPANEFVDLAITYKDRFHTPLAGKSLVWQLVEGEATLSRQTTTTDRDGNGTNSIQVALSDPYANATIRLAVWPEDEPDSKLEFECLFGAPRAAPPLSDKNILQIIYPRDDKNNQDPVSLTDLWEDVMIVGLYATGSGEQLPDDTIDILFRGTNSYSDQLPAKMYGVYAAHQRFVEAWKTMYDVVLTADGTSSLSNCYFDDGIPIVNRVMNFWPPAGSVLEPGYTYPLRAICVDQYGSVGVNLKSHIAWSVKDASPGIQIQIDPKDNPMNDVQIAVSTITCTHASFGADGTFTLKVSLQDAEEGVDLKFDYPTFKVGGPRFTSVKPQPDDTIYEASKGCPFEVIVKDANGGAPSGRFDIAWEASMQGGGKAYFQPTPTSLNINGLAGSTVFFLDVPQGKVQNFDVTITPSVGAPYTGTYKVTANEITQVSPVSDDPLPVGTPTAVQVSLSDYGGNLLGNQKLIVAQNNEITVSDFNPETNGDGIATIWVTSTVPRTTFLSISEAANCVPTTIQLNFCEKQNNITINPPTTDIRYDSRVALIATYVDGSGLSVPAFPLDIDFKLLDGTPVPHLAYPMTVNTDPYGKSAFWFYYSTDLGYPTSLVSMIATVSTPEGSAPPKSIRLDFVGGSIHNSMTLIQPTQGAPWPVGTPIEIIVRLTNDENTPLSHYSLKWNLPAGVSPSNEQDKTGPDGQASVMVTALSAGLLNFTVDVPDANIIGYPFSINFGGKDIYDGQLVSNKIYAHNPPGATLPVHDPAKVPPVDPSDDSQVVTFTYTYTKNGVPQPGEWIRWKTQPMSTSLKFFKEDNAPTDVRPGTLSTDIFTQTDPHGRAVLKVGGVSAFVGSMGAFPDINASIGTETSNFIINTFDESGFEDNLGYVTYTPPTLDISEDYSIDRPNFKLYVPEMSPEHKNDRVVFWIKSGITNPSPREVVKLVDMQAAISGVEFPFNDIVPDTDMGHSNKFSFMLVRVDGQGYRSVFVVPPVTGEVRSNQPLPDPARSLKAPHLLHDTLTVRPGDIANGLEVFVDFDPIHWKKGKIINLIVYLNHKDGSFGENIQLSKTVTQADCDYQRDVSFNLTYQQLNGYEEGSTMQADYYIDDNWSNILETAEFNTLDPFQV
ncbi:hypothetical protein JAU75_08140 [Ochrobactrum sp. Q0168]|uniref:hypothetical protein n=1 Tax=Ochrobactrum sp. Q0168 TaxID=2793241 RepID=UPI0018EC859E|nr:hypothetical protein [Ochrobactrum sp. Q0168]